ncbi:MAG: HNH endonuclease signature motif containing protein, partial [Actinomycetota bacterium]|nr:HNH endonuclease signature motif containing protein [Actinomycetota bacterium]
LNGEHDRTVLDMFGFDLPIDTIRRWACEGSITPVIVGLDGTRLMLGRTTRLASADQRRALAVLYRTCSCCDTPFDRCQIHHVDWWEKGGATDIDKMVPQCSRCHHLAHEGGHRLLLHADRSLTVIEPNGTVHEHAPPRVWPSRATAA